MMKFLIKILLMGLAMLIGAYLVPGIQVDGFLTAVKAAVLIAVANATIGSILRLLTFPVNFLTLGLVSFVITVLMVLLVDHYMSTFSTSGFVSAAILAIVVAVIRAILESVVGNDKD